MQFGIHLQEENYLTGEKFIQDSCDRWNYSTKILFSALELNKILTKYDKTAHTTSLTAFKRQLQLD
jgi:hypothetical protein